MNGCIPYFPNLEQCPERTMTFFPKKLVLETMKKINDDENLSFYEDYLESLLKWTREKLTTEAVALTIL